MELKNIDKEQLGQLIRSKAHFIDMYMKCRDRGKEIQELFNQVSSWLEEWKNRGYHLGPDKIWAEEIISKYKIWIQDKGIKKKQSSNQNVIKSNKFYEIIKTRRSIRFWKNIPVPAEVLNQIIESAAYAPSAFNRMPWKFYIYENKPENIVEGDSSNKSMFEKAPVRIYVAIDERLYEETYAPAMDAALAAQNILLAAHSLGLGSCFIYQCEIINQEMLKEKLNVPDYYKIYCAVLLGYPDDSPVTPGRVELDEIAVFIKNDLDLGAFLM